MLLFPLMMQGQLQLSPSAEVRVITCGPYQQELYSAFGHSAIRVLDTVNDIDLLYNYGVFNFNQPNFYLNFAKGHLKYRLAVSDYRWFVQSYIEEDRFVHEQIINLTPQQTQRVFDFLQWNAQPENMHYYYDYFYDNCATRVRDVFKHVLGDSLRFDDSYVQTNYTIRDLCDIYLQEQPWGDLGIDLCLGMPMDKTATPWMHMFLPDYIEKAFDNAVILSDDEPRPLVRETVVTYRSVPDELQLSWNTPLFWFSAFMIIGLLFTYFGFKRGRPYYAFDIALFTIIGIFGWFLVLLWFGTDHGAATNNLNVLWAIPFHFPVALWLLKTKKPTFLKIYFGITATISLAVLVFWQMLPQDLHPAVMPLVVLLAVRAFHLFRAIKVTKD